MAEPLIFVTIIALSIVFALIIAVVVLRFTTVMQQMKRADSMDRSELMRELDASHTQAFTNAMTALGEVQGRVVDSQVAMFNRTMDMVHGPVDAGDMGNDKEPYATDDVKLDMRAVWQTNDNDPDNPLQYLDPTDDDEWLRLAGDVQNDMGPRAVGVRPGESLIPEGG